MAKSKSRDLGVGRSSVQVLSVDEDTRLGASARDSNTSALSRCSPIHSAVRASEERRNGTVGESLNNAHFTSDGSRELAGDNVEHVGLEVAHDLGGCEGSKVGADGNEVVETLVAADFSWTHGVERDDISSYIGQ